MFIKLLCFQLFVAVINCKITCKYGSETSKTYIVIECGDKIIVEKNLSKVPVITYFTCYTSNSSEVYDLLPEFNDVEIMKSENVVFTFCGTPPSYSDFLRNFPNITEIYLNTLSPTQVMNENFFDQATNLAKLKILNSHDAEFTNSTFATMTNLTELILCEMSVQNLEKSFFRNNAKLFNFSLTNNLKPLSIGGDLFANKPCLTSVVLSNNQIRSGSVRFENMFENSTNLSKVDFSHNQIAGLS